MSSTVNKKKSYQQKKKGQSAKTHTTKRKKENSSEAAKKFSKIDDMVVRIPPDPTGYSTMYAERGRRLIRAYEEINPEVETEHLLMSLINDLIHICDRNPDLGDIHEIYVDAYHYYEKDLWEMEFPPEVEFPGLGHENSTWAERHK